jgi:hypothetical protein
MENAKYYFLEITSGLEKGKCIPVNEGAITFGRSSENIVSLHPDETSVSGHHAILYKSGDRIMLQDLQSTNGTFVNERRVTEQALYPGDGIRFGLKGPCFTLRSSETPLAPQTSAPRTAQAPISHPLLSRTLDGFSPLSAEKPGQPAHSESPPDKAVLNIKDSAAFRIASIAPGPGQENPASIGRYRIIKELGRGAMGKVFQAFDPILQRNIALKVIAMNPALSADARADYLSRFIVEARASAKLNHASIVQIYDAGEDQGSPWIAFQLIKGESLEILLANRRRLTLRRTVLFTLDIAAALEQAHSWNIIHRDIKPANILIE